ncbi:MAG: hypothetical protein ABI857_13270 [Acidobacteriota bacterium]
MNKIITAISLVMCCMAVGIAQDPDDGYKKGEFFVGYSNQQVDTGLGDIGDDLGTDISKRETFQGFDVSGVYNVSRYVGLKADVSGAYNNRSFIFYVPTPGGGTGNLAFQTKNALYNFLGGVQLKDNSKSGRLKPFAHAMIGAAHARTKVRELGCSAGVDCTGIESGSETGFAGVFGGGIDVRLNNRIQIRLIQADYNPVWNSGFRQDNIRFGFGLVF